MKKFFLVLFVIASGLSVYGQSTTPAAAKKPAATSQSSTVVNLNVDQYDWNKLILNHFFDKENGFGFQFWYKHSNATKRVRVYYQRRFTYTKEKNNIQITAGLGLQGTSRQHKTNVYQIYFPIELQYRYKINKDWNFSARAVNHFSFSPRASQGEHTVKTTTDLLFKYQKVGLLYRGDYLRGFKTGLRTNFQGGGPTYDLTKKLTVGAIFYTDLKENKNKLHVAFTTTYKF